MPQSCPSRRLGCTVAISIRPTLSHGLCLYFRFSLSLRDIVELLVWRQGVTLAGSRRRP